jgi:single-stranded-DNA-specific exonuclease
MAILTRKPKWIFPSHNESRLEELFPRFTRPERQILASLGFESQDTAIAFLNGEEEQDLDPLLMANMDSAVERIRHALEDKHAIAIYADYDADGVTSAALLDATLQATGVHPRVYFPDRFTEGYGLNAKALELLAAEGVKLVITVDCGIRAVRQAAFARTLGLDLIITDHHHPPEQLPDAAVILNPNLPDDYYPNKSLAGVGVAYKLARALLASLAVGNPPELIDLVAIGTVADMSPLTGENRQLVRAGLARINASPRTGIRALLNAAGYQPGKVDARAIGFVIGPRINAAGRLESARLAFDLLVSDDETAAIELAEKLDHINQRRQDLTYEVVDAATEQITEYDRRVLAAFHEDYHEGVVGLAASRLTDEYYRPSLVGKIGPTSTRASARSIPGFHLAKALDTCSSHLLRFGGHARAAGFTVENSKIDSFLAQFEEVAQSMLDDELLTPKLELHADISLDEIDGRLLKFHDRLEPTGQENPHPLLATRAVRIVYRRQVGDEGRHLKLRLASGSTAIDAIGFRLGQLMRDLPEVVDVAYRLEMNEYRGTIAPQLVLADIRPAED